MTDAEIVIHAIERLSIPIDRHEALKANLAAVIDDLLQAGLYAGFRPASMGRLGSPTSIVKAIDEIAAGLSQIERGLQQLDDARRSNAAGNQVRGAELERLQHGTLRAIVCGISSRLPGHNLSDDLVESAMPRYGTDWFAGSWNGVFSGASDSVAGLGRLASVDRLRAKKTPDEWRDRLIVHLAAAFEALTDERATAFRPGGNPKPDYRSQFCRFVADLWPIWFPAPAAAPSNGTIERALTAYRTTK
ncbi:MAG: hypothetical protein J0H88_13810 [Sphingomonadales bacterium]|nr:hypothetical protein [Sphingomonadales bacterium]